MGGLRPDFVIKFPHCECVSKIPRSAFKDKYYRWCNKNGYYYSDKKADAIYDYSKTLVPTLPDSDYISALMEQSATQLNCACETLAELHRQMTVLSEQLPEYDAVMEMFGVGKVLASQLIAKQSPLSLGLTLRLTSPETLMLSPAAFQSEAPLTCAKHFFRSFPSFSRTVPKMNPFTNSSTRNAPKVSRTRFT